MADIDKKVDKINKIIDQHSIFYSNRVIKQINHQNQKLIPDPPSKSSVTNNYNTHPGAANPITTVTVNNTFVPPEEIKPSSYIDMENEIYKNEFEGCGSIEIRDVELIRETGYAPLSVEVGLIDSVSENEDDMYAKLPDGEIVPFKGYAEKFEIEIFTWNDLQRSNLIGSEIKKAATCHILINDKLARIIEGINIQELLIKAARAIDELKVMPFSICRDAQSLIGRKIYYSNQPAIIRNIDEINNLIFIIPDPSHIVNFAPPAYAIEDYDPDEWVKTYGQGMMIHDYDEKIWWWRDNNVKNFDPSTDQFYKQFPQPIQPINPINPNIYPLSPGINIYPDINTSSNYLPGINTYTGINTGGGTYTLTTSPNKTSDFNIITLDLSLHGDINKESSKYNTNKEGNDNNGN